MIQRKQFNPKKFIDREFEQELFEELLAFPDAARILAIRDASGTGKSHLLELFRYRCRVTRPRTPVSLIDLKQLPDQSPMMLIKAAVKDLADLGVPFPRFTAYDNARVSRDFEFIRASAYLQGAGIKGAYQAILNTASNLGAQGEFNAPVEFNIEDLHIVAAHRTKRDIHTGMEAHLMEALELARQALLVLAPFVAQGALAKIGEDTTDHVTRLVGRAWGLLGGGARNDPQAAHALAVYQDEPDDERNRERLAQGLAAYLQQQRQAADELRAAVEELRRRAPDVQVNFTNSGENQGQQVGVNYGSMTQRRQDIHNAAPNQGAQGVFEGPVTFNQQRYGNQYNAARDIVQAGGDITQIGGDQINAQGSQGFINRPSGPVSQHFGDVTHGDSAAFAQAFAQIYAAIDARPPDADVDKEEIAATVKNIEQEARKGDAANEKKLDRWLRSLAVLAADIFDITVAALTGPQAAFAAVARRAAARVKQEQV